MTRTCASLALLLLAAVAVDAPARAQGDLAAAAAEPQPRGAPVPCAGRTIDAVHFSGCAGTRCEDQAARAELLKLAAVPLGEPYEAAWAAAAVERLVATKFFHTVVGLCEESQGRTTLVLAVEGTWVVRAVEIDGNQYFYESDVRRRVFLRPGTVLDPRPERLAEDLARQEESIRRLYAREGFSRADVTVRAEAGDPGEAVVRVRVDEGPKDRVSDVDVVFRRLPDVPERVGCPALGRREVRDAAGISRGDIFTALESRRARKRLLAYVRQLGYIAPDVDVPEFDPASGRVTLAVALGRCYDVAFYLRPRADRWDESWRRVWDEQLAAALPFGESGTFDEEEAEYGRQELEQLYEARGHLFADVRLDYRDYRTDRTGADHPPDVQGAVHYRITEDEALEIRDIHVHQSRPSPFDGDTVRGWMETNAYDFFDEGGYLQVQQLLWDLAAVRERFREEGFRQLRYLGCEAVGDPEAPGWTRPRRRAPAGEDADRGAPAAADVERGDRPAPPAAAGDEGAPGGVDDDERIRRRVWRRGTRVVASYAARDTCFSVVRETDEASVYVHVFLDPGPRSVVAGVEIEGATLLPADAVRAAFELPVGTPFSTRKVAEAVQRVRGAYHRGGVYPVEVDVSCATAELLRGACRLDRVTAGEVRLHVAIREGTPRVVGPRFVRGNFRTTDGTVLRDLPEPGAPYDEERILDGVRRLRDLGVFESLKVTAVGLEEDPPRRDIALVVDVEESDAKFLDLALGFETLNRDEQSMPTFLTRTLSGGIGAADQRASGFGEGPLVRLPDLLIVFEAGFVHRNFLGLAKELHLPLKYGLSTTALNRLASFRPTYLDSRFLGYELLFRLTPFVVYDRATQALDEFEYGVQTEVAKQLTSALYGSLEYELSRIQVRNPREEGAEFGPFTLQNKLSPRLAWDRTDHPLHPTKGWYLGGSLSYINALQEARFDNFLKWEFSAKAFVSLRATVIIGMFVQYGGSYSFDAADLPLAERYRLGGSKGLRGFADDAVGQYDRRGDLKLVEAVVDGQTVLRARAPGGDQVLSGTVEVRFPVVRKLDLWAAVFFDWGALEEDLRDLHPMSFRTSAGFGFRWLAGGQIPIRFDYGIPIERRCRGYDVTTDAGGAESLECVEEDFGTLNFGILYTF